jgi:hypothetical protein
MPTVDTASVVSDATPTLGNHLAMGAAWLSHPARLVQDAVDSSSLAQAAIAGVQSGSMTQPTYLSSGRLRDEDATNAVGDVSTVSAITEAEQTGADHSGEEPGR